MLQLTFVPPLVKEASHASLELFSAYPTIAIIIHLLHQLVPEQVINLKLAYDTVSIEVAEAPLELINVQVAITILIKQIERLI